MKKCTKCNEDKKINMFYKHSYSKDGYKSQCKKCMNKATMEGRRTYSGCINRMYWQQCASSKTRGHEPPKYHLWEFFIWCIDNGYKNLHKEWVDSEYDTMLIPSADRIDNSKGYSFNNIQLVTWKENLKNAKNDINKVVYQFTKDGFYVGCYESMQLASDVNDICRSSISKCRNGERKTAGGFIWKKSLK